MIVRHEISWHRKGVKFKLIGDGEPTYPIRSDGGLVAVDPKTGDREANLSWEQRSSFNEIEHQ